MAAYLGTLTPAWFYATRESADEARFAYDQYSANQAAARANR